MYSAILRINATWENYNLTTALLALMYNVVLLLTALPELHIYLFIYLHCKSNRFSRLWKRHFFPPLHLPGRRESPCYSNQLSRWSGQFITGSLGRYWRLAEVRGKHVHPIWRSPALLAKASSPSRIINSPPPAPSPLRLQRGYTLLAHDSRDSQKVGNFKGPGHGIFPLSSQQAGEIVAQGGRRDSPCRWIVLTFCCLEVWLRVVTFKIPRFCCTVPVFSSSFCQKVKLFLKALFLSNNQIIKKHILHSYCMPNTYI